MTELQTILLEAMVQFDALCEREQLTYYMLGGTMLGAYRHQGFIPWDDDIDIGMPRADYERLLRLTQEQLPFGYEVRHFSKEKNVPYAFAHFENANTTYVEERRSGGGYKGGVYLEIFPLDKTAETRVQAVWMEKKIWFLKKILYATLLQGKTGENRRLIHSTAPDERSMVMEVRSRISVGINVISSLSPSAAPSSSAS